MKDKERERIKDMAREAGWLEVPTVRGAFSGFDLYHFATLVIQYATHHYPIMGVEPKNNIKRSEKDEG